MKATKTWTCSCCGETINPGDDFTINQGDFLKEGHSMETNKYTAEHPAIIERNQEPKKKEKDFLKSHFIVCKVGFEKEKPIDLPEAKDLVSYCQAIADTITPEEINAIHDKVYGLKSSEAKTTVKYSKALKIFLNQLNDGSYQVVNDISSKIIWCKTLSLADFEFERESAKNRQVKRITESKEFEQLELLPVTHDYSKVKRELPEQKDIHDLPIFNLEYQNVVQTSLF